MELRPSSVAWGAVVGGVLAYDMLCPRGETMSERLDPILETGRGRALLYTAIGATAIHLCNGFERLGVKRLDPFSFALDAAKNRCRNDG